MISLMFFVFVTLIGVNNAGICEDMCRERISNSGFFARIRYEQCLKSCPGYEGPDSTPGVMTWDELLEQNK